MKRALIFKSPPNINKSPLEKYLDYRDITDARLRIMAHFNEAQSRQSAGNMMDVRRYVTSRSGGKFADASWSEVASGGLGIGDLTYSRRKTNTKRLRSV